ncbi:MAG: sel1 repeat family protein [Bacteroidales bacterium]|nr:sel1 repeat family protein [Bacteroidales bacterium]
MKKYILICLALLMGVTASARTLSTEQMQLRRDIVNQLAQDGYSPDIDSDGDVSFTKDKIKYCIIINEKWEDPFMYTVYAKYNYTEADWGSRENVEKCVSWINQTTKTVKIYCETNGYTYRADVLCYDSEIFPLTYKANIKEIEKANKELMRILKSDMADVYAASPEDAFAKGLAYYLTDENEKAFLVFQHLEAIGYTSAYAMLGVLYENGNGVERDEDLMVEYYQKALDSGSAWTAYKLGDYYYGKKDYEQAMAMFVQCSASDNSYRSDSYYRVGEMNEKGQGVSVNRVNAVKNYRKSVEYSTELECDARLALIRLGEQAEDPSLFVDATKSMLVGLTEEEMFQRGNEYEQGLNNRTISLPKAYAYFKAAADKKHPQAYTKMGEIYLSEYYPFKDKSKSDKYYGEAFKLLKKKEQDPEACYQLGRMYRLGLSVSPNQEQAKLYFMRGAEKGNVGSNYELGLIYRDELEYVDAFNCFLKAAEEEQPNAMLEVAKAYETGSGTAKNRDKAISWYKKCVISKDRQVKQQAKESLSKYQSTGDDKE